MADDRGPSLTTILILGALALFGAITLVQWVLGAVFWFVRLVLVVVVIGAVLAAVAGRKASRGP